MRALHPGLTACAVLVYDDILTDRTGTALPDNVIALSKGELPAAGAGTGADGDLHAEDAADGDTGASSSSSGPGRPKKLPLPAVAGSPPPRLGDMVRVVDKPLLMLPLCLSL